MTSSNVWFALVFGCAFFALPPAHATTHDGSGQNDSHASATQAGNAGASTAPASSENGTTDNGGSGAITAPRGTRASAADGGSCTDNAATSLPKGNADCTGNGNSGSGSSSPTLGWQSLLPGSIQ